MAKSSESVKVMVRCRPMSQKEIDRGCSCIVTVDKAYGQINLAKPNSGEIDKTFSFDSVYGQDSQQRSIYDESAFPLVESVIEGYNGTIFAYGQTGCGKTHTMMGSYESEETQGIIPKAFGHIFGCIDSSEDGKKFLVRCSYLEIYNESILDLLGKEDRKLDVKEDKDKGIYVKGLTNVIVKSIPEIEKAMVAGTKNRKVGETAMNKDSSRSHSIFTIYIETAEDGTDGNQRFRAGKLNLVDLAGSERQSKTNATGDRLKEAQKINLSLSALGNVISALVDGRSTHIPYRDSKLTRLLQDSLGGNTKTVMIAAVSPADYNYDETLSTLRYASRAKNIKNKPKVNEDPKDALLRQYEEEIKMLKDALLKLSQGGTPADTTALLHKLSMNFTAAIKGENVQESIEDVVNNAGSSNPLSFHHAHIPNSQRLEELEKLSKEQENNKSSFAEKEKAIEMDSKQKEELQSIIKDMEEKLMKGGDVLEAKEKMQAKAYREFQLKLQKQKNKEKKLKEEQMKREEEMMTNFQDLQEEVDDKVKIVNKLRKRYKAALNEIKDLEEEHQSEKEDLLESIRNLEKDLSFYKIIVSMVMKEDHLYKIKAKSKYEIENNKWTVPAFIFKAEELNFPKLKGNRIKEMIENEKESKILEFNGGQVESIVKQNSNSKPQNGVYRTNSNNDEKEEDFEDKNFEDFQSPDKIEENGFKGYNSTSSNSDYLQTDYQIESRMLKEKSQENVTFNTKGVLIKQKSIRKNDASSRFEKAKAQSNNQSKLPPSIRWVSTDDDPDPDFFSPKNKQDKRYERNPKAIAQLAPLVSNMKNDSYKYDWRSGTITEPNEVMMSTNDLSLKKKGKLRPLRE